MHKKGKHYEKVKSKKCKILVNQIYETGVEHNFMKSCNGDKYYGR